MRFYGIGPKDAARAIEASAFALREPHNPHDPNAIAIFSDGQKLGHVDKRSSAMVAPLLDAGASCAVAPDPTGAVANLAIPLVITLKMLGASSPCPDVCKGIVAGIYEIRVVSEQKSYFGQSVDVQDRIRTHWSDLSVGWHANPELQRYWQNYGPTGFQASLKQAAPKQFRDLELARWLTLQERRWIEHLGGMRRVINAEWPKPVLGKVAKKQLELERQAARGDLTALADQIERLERSLAAPVARLTSLQASVTETRKWWGVFASSNVRDLARQAESDVPALKEKIADTRAELARVQCRLSAKMDHLFL